jgi:hypothetical protein
VLDSNELDGLFRDLLRFHWVDESRHAVERRSGLIILIRDEAAHRHSEVAKECRCAALRWIPPSFRRVAIPVVELFDRLPPNPPIIVPRMAQCV